MSCEKCEELKDELEYEKVKCEEMVEEMKADIDIRDDEYYLLKDENRRLQLLVFKLRDEISDLKDNSTY